MTQQFNNMTVMPVTQPPYASQTRAAEPKGKQPLRSPQTPFISSGGQSTQSPQLSAAGSAALQRRPNVATNVPNPQTPRGPPGRVQPNPPAPPQQIIYENFKDPRSQVQSTSQIAPREAITPRELQAEGIFVSRALYGTPGETERLFAEYKIRPNARRFFREGRVFLVLWAEPAGGNSTLVSKETVVNHLGELVYSKIRRFVVIREGENYCSALPIATYTGRGVSKSTTRKSEHVVIYTGRQVPSIRSDELPQPGELGMRDHPIRVDPDKPTDKLDPMSRLDLAGVHTIQHNVKVKPFGTVNGSDLTALKQQFKLVWNKSTAPRPSTVVLYPRTTARAAGSSRTPTQPPDAEASSESDDDGDEEDGEDGSDDDEEDDGDDEEDDGEEQVAVDRNTGSARTQPRTITPSMTVPTGPYVQRTASTARSPPVATRPALNYPAAARSQPGAWSQYPPTQPGARH